MTRDDIIRMAMEARLYSGNPRTPGTEKMIVPRLERFAALVAAAEREACAKVVEILIPEQTEDGLIGHTIAKAIREARRLPPYTTPPVQEFVCSTGFCRFTLTQTGVGINVPDEEKCKK